MMKNVSVVADRQRPRRRRLCVAASFVLSSCLFIIGQKPAVQGFSPSHYLIMISRQRLVQKRRQQQHSSTTIASTTLDDVSSSLPTSTSTAAVAAEACSSSSKETTNTTITNKKRAAASASAAVSSWFPRRIQETIDYNAVVERLYLRHVVTETPEMAQLVLSEYQKQQQQQQTASSDSNDCTNDSISSSSSSYYYSLDPFADLARRVSACTMTRHDGGKIGWVDRHASYEMQKLPLPGDVVQALYELQPKMGDVYILQATASTRQWHVVQVLELWINPLAQAAATTTSTTTTVKKSDDENGDDNEQQQQQKVILPVGAHGGHNVVLPRRTLKGQGVTPTGFALPLLRDSNYSQERDGETNRKTNNNNKKTTMSYSIQTAGCQMNVADSERIEGILQHQLSMTRATNADEADLILFNTCSIRDRAEQQVYNALGPFAARKRNGQHSLGLIVTGCVAQQEGEALLRRVPEVDVVIGPQYVPFLKNVLEQVAWGHQVVATAPMLLQEEASHHSRTVSNDNDRAGLFTKPVRGHDVRAWVNVIFGCNEHCTYCVVPATRGMEQSRSMEAILQECMELAEAGYKEVTLLGQNIDAYGRDMVPKRTFADLLGFLNDRIPTKMRIRYVTSHPRYFSNRVIDAVANLDKVCECFHMPFQAGDDAVLRAMRRGYDAASYLKIIDKIREKAPDAAICADVIVGFPGETDEAFEKTLELMEKVKFDNLNSFAYSPRPNTEAALWEHDEKKNLLVVPEAVKAERLQRVQQLATQHGLERSMRYLGRAVEVLVEDANPRNPNEQVMGRTRQGRQVYFDGCLDELRGEFVQVHITKARTWSLMGELVSR